MDEDLNAIIVRLHNARHVMNKFLEDCPDVQEGKIVDRALKKVESALELCNKAKYFKDDKLTHRG